jgi:hypothetical protein
VLKLVMQRQVEVGDTALLPCGCLVGVTEVRGEIVWFVIDLPVSEGCGLWGHRKGVRTFHANRNDFVVTNAFTVLMGERHGEPN